MDYQYDDNENTPVNESRTRSSEIDDEQLQSGPSGTIPNTLVSQPQVTEHVNEVNQPSNFSDIFALKMKE